MASAQEPAVNIEFILRNVFNCDRLGIGGLVNSDYIRKYPFHAMMCGLTYIYSTADTDKRESIDNFFNEYSYYASMSVDYLLEFKTSVRIDGGTEIAIEFENGQLQIDHIINEFEKLCNM